MRQGGCRSLFAKRGIGSREQTGIYFLSNDPDQQRRAPGINHEKDQKHTTRDAPALRCIEGFGVLMPAWWRTPAASALHILLAPHGVRDVCVSMEWAQCCPGMPRGHRGRADHRAAVHHPGAAISCNHSSRRELRAGDARSVPRSTAEILQSPEPNT